MNDFTKKHLDEWIERTVLSGYRGATRMMIVAFVDEYPDLIEKGYSWPEIAKLAVDCYENQAVPKLD